MAQIAEQGSGDDDSRRLRGRPSLTAGTSRGHRSRQLSIRISGMTERRLASYIESTNEKPSDIVRQALDEFLDRQGRGT